MIALLMSFVKTQPCVLVMLLASYEEDRIIVTLAICIFFSKMISDKSKCECSCWLLGMNS